MVVVIVVAFVVVVVVVVIIVVTSGQIGASYFDDLPPLMQFFL